MTAEDVLKGAEALLVEVDGGEEGGAEEVDGSVEADGDALKRKLLISQKSCKTSQTAA